MISIVISSIVLSIVVILSIILSRTVKETFLNSDVKNENALVKMTDQGLSTLLQFKDLDDKLQKQIQDSTTECKQKSDEAVDEKVKSICRLSPAKPASTYQGCFVLLKSRCGTYPLNKWVFDSDGVNNHSAGESDAKCQARKQQIENECGFASCKNLVEMHYQN